MDFARAAAEMQPQVVAWRRHLHRHPDLSWREQPTQAWLMDRLRECGLTPRAAGHTGVLAEIVGGRPGPTIALRADIDALPVEEKSGVEFASENPGVMHACGHDAHAAMLLGAATVLARHRAELAGTIRLIFQPAEETVPPHIPRLAETGAGAMIDDGALRDAQAVFGMHIFSYLPRGLIEVTAGPVMAGSLAFDIEVVGKGGHAGLPHGTVDALAVAAHMVVALRSMTTLGADPLEPVVVHIGMLQAGEARTAIAERAQLRGTIRFLSKWLLAEVRAKIERTVAGVAASFGATATVSFSSHLNCPVVNDAGLVKGVRALAAAVVGDGAVIERKPMMGAEDFYVYLERVRGVYIGLGGGDFTNGPPAGHHSPHFVITEDAMQHGVELWLRVAMHAAELAGA